MRTCYSCFNTYGDEFEVCPYCGTVSNDKPEEPIYLAPGTMLAQRYLLGYAIGAGGFGIIYRAWDMKLETVVAVKEFFANRLMTRAVGKTEVIINKKSYQEFEYRKERFIAEARTMAKFGNHRNIPNVFESFEENGTAYIVMELLIGQPLNEYLHHNGNIVDRDFALHIANEVGKALISLHEAGIVHRDVAPDNIFICEDMRVKLLDLGAAKLADNTDDVIDIILKPGYSPVEQYDNTASIGAWTDIYALGATLYVMLTGVKPEESTNRKIKDTLVSPNELEPTIPDNLANAIMKAMAIDRYMRFKSVDEFLKAINGEKKIVSLKKEKRRRAAKRIIGIIAAVLVVAVISGIVVNLYSSKKKAQGLPDAEITIWFSVKENSTELEAMKTIVDDFTEKHPNVQIIATAMPEETYRERLEEAAKTDSLPTIFESTDVSDDVLSKTVDLSKVLESDQAKSCLFLDQYDRYYTDKKQLPLAIEVPMAYVITNGNVSVDFDQSTFSSPDDFNTEKIAVDEARQDLIKKNFDIDDAEKSDKFLNNDENECAVMFSTNMAMNVVRETLTNYEKTFAYYTDDKVFCKYDYEWSIGGGSDNEIVAAERLLEWMLGNNYQNILMISRNSDGQIPINKECFETKINRNNYSAIKDIYQKYTFEK